jgi:hypothetical protein
MEKMSSLGSNRNKLSRGQALDIPLIDHELLKLFLPQIQSMFKYFKHESILHSINLDALSDENEYSSLAPVPHDQVQQQVQPQMQQQMQQQQQQHDYQDHHDPSTKYFTNIVMYLMKGIMLYSTLLHHDIATPGMNNLKTTFKPSTSSISTSTSISRSFNKRNHDPHKNKVYRYLLLSTVLPLLHQLVKWKASNYENQTNEDSNTNNGNGNRNRNRNRNDNTNTNGNSNSNSNRNGSRQELIGIRRKLYVLRSILKLTSFIIPPLQLYTYISHMLYNTASPTLSMKWSGLQYDTYRPSLLSSSTSSTSTSSPQEHNQRSVNFSYAQRRLWYEEMVITCGMIIPIEFWKEMPALTRMFISK